VGVPLSIVADVLSATRLREHHRQEEVFPFYFFSTARFSLLNHWLNFRLFLFCCCFYREVRPPPPGLVCIFPSRPNETFSDPLFFGAPLSSLSRSMSLVTSFQLPVLPRRAIFSHRFASADAISFFLFFSSKWAVSSRPPRLLFLRFRSRACV